MVTGSVACVETPIGYKLQRFTSPVLQACLKNTHVRLRLNSVAYIEYVHTPRLHAQPLVSVFNTGSTRGNITEVMILSLQLEFSHHCGQPEVGRLGRLNAHIPFELKLDSLR